MAQTIKLKRSASQGAVPSTSALALGEIAINTYDGKLFIKKNDGSESIVTIGSLENNAVTSAKIAANAVTSSEVAANAIGSSEIAANSVGISELNVSDGSTGQVLTTDGSGNLSFSAKTATAQSFYLNTATGDGNSTDFTLSTTPAAESYIIAFVDGVFQNQDSYTFSGTTLTFDTAPTNGSTVTVYVVGSIYSGNSVVLDTFSGDDLETAFTLSENPQSENNTQVYIDGVYQQKSEYSVSGTTLTFSSAPPTGTNNIEVIAFTSTNFSVLNANSVTSASIASGAVNTSDIADNAITSAKIASGVIVASDVADNSITSAKIALNAVGASELAATALSGHDTDDLSEGSTNLYYTDARAQAVSINNVVEDTTPQLGGDLASNGNDILFADSDKAIFGTGSDLQIYHDGSNSYVKENGTGQLVVNATNLYLRNSGNTNDYLTAIDGGAVRLLYANSAKLATTSAGIDVTGEVLADSLDIDGNGDISGNLTLGGYLAGPATFTIDPAAVGDNTGTVVIAGNLQVDGTTTTINSTTLTVDDKLVTLASGSINAAAADGAGIEVEISGATNPSLTYDGTNDEWDFNKNVNVTGTVTATDLLIDTDVIVTDSTNDRVGINKTSPATTLDVSGSIYFSSILRGTSDGSASSPTIQPGNDGDTGLFRPTTNTIGFTTAGSEAMRINASGYVGINEQNPAVPLHVTKDSASGENIAFMLDNNNTTAGNEIGMLFRSMVGSTNTDFEIFGVANGANDMDLVFQSDGSVERVRFTGDGNVGIGTSSPDTLLHLNSTTGAVLRLARQDGSVVTNDILGSLEFYTSDVTNTGVAGYINVIAEGGAAGGAMLFGTGTGGSASEQVRITQSGNVGIGTDSPQDVLHVKNPTPSVGDTQVILEGAPAGYGTGISFQAELTGGSLKEMARIVADGSASWNTTTTTQDARLRFFTTNDGTAAEKMVITHDGNVGIGTGGTSSPNRLISALSDSATVITNGNVNLELTNTNGSNNTYSRVFFNDTVGGAASAIIGAKHIDTTNNYGNLEFWVRASNTGAYVFNSTGARGTYLGLQKNGTTTGYIAHQGVWLGNTSDTHLSLIGESGSGVSIYTNGSTTRRMFFDTDGHTNLYGNSSTWRARMLPGGWFNFRGDHTENNGGYLSSWDDNSGIVSGGGYQTQSGWWWTSNRTSACVNDSGQIMFYANYGPGTAGQVNTVTIRAKINDSSDSGDFYTNDGTVSSLSDSRLKTNVQNLADGLDILTQLRPVTFEYNDNSVDERGREQLGKADGVTRYGFIAQEVESVAPHYVNTDIGMIGGEEVEDLKSMSQTRLIPMLVKSIQELNAKLEAAEARITELEG